MRSVIVVFVAIAGVLLLLADNVTEAQVKQPPKKQPKQQPKSGKGGFGTVPPDVLAQYENQIKQNPDVAVADATRLLAMAELNRVRQQVGVKIAGIYAELEGAKGVLAQAEKKVTGLRSAKEGSADLASAQQTVTKAKAAVALWQAELTSAIGDKKDGAIVVVVASYKEAVERAAKKNSDILAAQAKVTQAEEELSTMRKIVAGKMAANRVARENADAVLKDAQAKLARMQQQFTAGTATQAQLESATATVTASQSEFNRLQIELTYLTGGSIVLIDSMKGAAAPQPSASLFGK
ncbi:MAG TPA: hypothetical protein VE988_01830 [Gemmataceae bacterium]|nr:hypothetical protein [Gemmataceae bacterium]